MLVFRADDKKIARFVRKTIVVKLVCAISFFDVNQLVIGVPVNG